LDALNISTSEVIQSIEAMIKKEDTSEAFSSPKSVINHPDGRYIMATLACSDNPPIVVTKSALMSQRNAERGLPQINSLVTVLDGETGIPQVTIDGNWITAVRTAGLSATASKYLAKVNSETVGFIGAGVQARSHLRAFSELFPLKHIKIYSRGKRNIELLTELACSLGLSVDVNLSPQEIVANSDIVTTSVATSAISEPFLDANWLGSDAFAAVPAEAAWFPASLSSLDEVFIDDQVQEDTMSTKLVDPDIVSGDLKFLIETGVKHRRAAKKSSAFVFRGHAMGDLAVAALILNKLS
jgi:ornithine cyclodeaminase/alanine dehydrogenase